jgi:hypothetical protein
MPEDPRTVVTFRSASFNTAETKPHYINPYSYGDDVAEWIRDQLKVAGVIVDSEIGQEDFGWYFGFQVGQQPYQFIIGYNPDEYWVGWLERNKGLVGSLLGARNRGIGADAANAIHSVLRSSDKIHDIRWHYKKAFDDLKEEMGSTSPV